ncbi:NfeD family protein [Nitrospira sp. KM1]|uniref:NfeD family protein n=1 Tax=Nitrospira sp. KM1 TaxID=1936990 RepID=UPI001565C129|nr:NfeD family protein [Nitrospira sp. KM1]
MIWWYWMVLGLVLFGAEMTTPGGFYMIFFGLSAIAIGTLGGLDLVVTDWLQWLLFSVIAVASLLLFRGPLMERIKPTTERSSRIDSLVGEIAVSLAPLGTGETGKAELRGTTWNVKNIGPTTLGKGQRGRVAQVDGLTLLITAE